MSDCTEQLLAAVARALDNRTGLEICGGNSKAHTLGRDVSTDNTEQLQLSGHTGIIDYHPAELVLTARAGTTLSEITAILANEGQMLSFEPPEFNGAATLGGTLACNLSGPARPWSGSIRDMVLGVQLINGRAELLNFGGQVMKNVAGYDVSRLQAGALGTLGVLTRISLKVLPLPESSLTLSYELDAPAALELMTGRAAQAKPLSGAYWSNGVLYLRLSGAENAVLQTARHWGGEQVANCPALWRQLREFEHSFFSGDEALWRLSHSPTAPVAGHEPTLIDWGGAQRWLRGELDRAALARVADKAGGHFSLFRGGDRFGEVRHAVSSLEKKLQQRLKHAFDPSRIFNPGRLYAWM